MLDRDLPRLLDLQAAVLPSVRPTEAVAEGEALLTVAATYDADKRSCSRRCAALLGGGQPAIVGRAAGAEGSSVAPEIDGRVADGELAMLAQRDLRFRLDVKPR